MLDDQTDTSTTAPAADVSAATSAGTAPGGDVPAGEGPCAILGLVLRHGTPSVRPDDVLAGLREVSGLEHTGSALAERLAQGPLDERSGTVGDPLAPDRDAV